MHNTETMVSILFDLPWKKRQSLSKIITQCIQKKHSLFNSVVYNLRLVIMSFNLMILTSSDLVVAHLYRTNLFFSNISGCFSWFDCTGLSCAGSVCDYLYIFLCLFVHERVYTKLLTQAKFAHVKFIWISYQIDVRFTLNDLIHELRITWITGGIFHNNFKWTFKIKNCYFSWFN